MKTKLTLVIEDGLTPTEIDALKQLFYDALGEFRTARGPDTETYVRRRYKLFGDAFHRKIAEVEARKQLAQKLRAAASDIGVEHVDA